MSKIAENVGKLKDLMGECMKSLEAIHKKCLADEAAKDEKSKSIHQAEFEAKSLEFKRLENRFETVKEMARQNEVLREAEMLGKTVQPGVIPAEPVDHQNDEQLKERNFTKWFCGKTLSDAERSSLQPHGKWNADSDSSRGLALPTRFADAILPERRITGPSYAGKALPMISTAAPGSDLYLKEFKPEILMYEPEPVRLFDKVMKIPTTRGDVLWPKLVQPAPTAEGTAAEFGEIGSVATEWTAEGSDKPETEPTFTQLEIRCWEVSGYTELSHILIRRAQVDILGLLQTLFRASLLHKIDEALFNGDGNGKPEGIIVHAGVGAPDRLATGLLDWDDFVECEHAVAPQLRPGGIYIINDGALKAVKEIKDSFNRPLFMPNPAGLPFTFCILNLHYPHA